MTVAPDKRDNNVEGRNVYELFNYQIINPMIRKNSGLLILNNSVSEWDVFERLAMNENETDSY